MPCWSPFLVRIIIKTSIKLIQLSGKTDRIRTLNVMLPLIPPIILLGRALPTLNFSSTFCLYCSLASQVFCFNYFCRSLTPCLSPFKKAIFLRFKQCLRSFVTQCLLLGKHFTGFTGITLCTHKSTYPEMEAFNL